MIRVKIDGCILPSYRHTKILQKSLYSTAKKEFYNRRNITMPELAPNTSVETDFSETARSTPTRRQALELLGLGALSLVTTAHAADNVITAQRFNHLTTDVKIFETHNRGNGELTMVLGGLGVQDSEP